MAMTEDDIARIDGSVAAYTNVLCRDCRMIMTNVNTETRKCPQCGVTADVRCTVSVTNDES